VHPHQGGVSVRVASRLKARAISTLEPAAIRIRGRNDPIVLLRSRNAWVDPYSIYEAMRAKGPVYYSKTTDMHVITGFEEANAAFKDPRFRAGTLAPQHNAVSALGSPDSLLKLNPPRHTQIRKLVSKAFSARAIEQMAGWITELAHELVDEVVGRQEFDVVAHVAYPLPLRVVTRVLGIPQVDEDQFAEWGMALGNTLEPFIPREQWIAGRAADKAMYAYLEGLVQERRASPGDDMLSALIAATDDDGVRLTDNELLVNCQVILVAGFGTMVGMISSGMNILVDRPDLWQRLQADRSLVANLVEEVLRLESPIQMTPRHVAEDVDLGGHQIGGGRRALIVEGAANRDPRMFPDPTRLDLDRENASKNLAFAGGPHYCLGAALARLQGRIGFDVMLDRMPKLARAGVPERRPLLTARGFNTVPVAVQPSVLPRTTMSVPSATAGLTDPTHG
jgi:cytochrome P450